MTALGKKDSVAAALSVAEDIGSGKLSPADLEAELLAEVKALVGTVVGEGDSLFPLQIEIARGVLAAGGLSVDEQAEWLSIAKHRAQMGSPDAEGTDTPAQPGSSPSVAYSSSAAYRDGDG